MSFPAFQTPQRPLPGAFLQTPAASRYQGPGPARQLFRTQSSSSAPGISAERRSSSQPVGALVGPPTQAQILKPVQRAARTINEVLRKDANFPELDSYVKRKFAQRIRD
jgi:nuclear pore complex protein Nup155